MINIKQFVLKKDRKLAWNSKIKILGILTAQLTFLSFAIKLLTVPICAPPMDFALKVFVFVIKVMEELIVV